MKSKAKKSGFSIIELLTVMSIIIILLGILVPSLGAVRRYARVVRQKGYFHDITKCLESFSIDHDGYPDSSYLNLDGDAERYCGAMKLCEAMVGQDGMGFHPDSLFDATDVAKLYFNRTPLQNPDDPQGADRLNLQARQLCLQGEDVQVASMDNLFGVYGGPGPFDPCCPVLCDVFKRTQLRIGDKKAGMPILYYKADTSQLLHDIREIAGGQPTYTSGKNIYNYYDNYELIELGVPWTGEDHPYKTPPVPKVEGQIFYEDTTDESVPTMDKPHKPDGYLLISAGWDAKYGTEDDVHNFD